MRKVIFGFFLILAVFGTGNWVRAEKKISGRMVWRLSISPPPGAKKARLWLPYPRTDRYQRIRDPEVFGNYAYHGLFTDERGNLILYAEWDLKRTHRPEMVLSYRVLRWEVVRSDFPEPPQSFNPENFKEFLSGNRYVEVGGEVRKLALEITRGKTSVRDKARAIYDWMVDNLRRDPKVKGCGKGIVCKVLKNRCGKCADINSVFVALCRAAGIPAREVFGLRLGREDGENLTGAQHCWAEFFVPGYGWVPADPADVLKAALIKGLSPRAPELRPVREYYFGAVDAYRVKLSEGRDLIFNPPQEGEPVNYFVYPYLEIDGRPVDIFRSPILDFEITWEKE